RNGRSTPPPNAHVRRFAYTPAPTLPSSPRAVMSRRTTAIVATGEMGSAVGAALVEGGYRVVTDLTGRSAQSRELAARAGIEDLGSPDAIVAAADIVLSILPPAAAAELASTAAEACERTHARPPLADCHAVSPDPAAAP